MKVAICIGHSRPGDNGASSVGGVSEWKYNVPVGEHLCKMLNLAGVETELINEYQGSSYGSAMTWLADRLDEMNPDCAIELHFNAAGESAQGFEYLHFHTSTNSKRLAQCLSNAQASILGGVNRGIKSKRSGDRGSAFLSKPDCPTVITEPFFGSNPSEWEIFGTDHAQIKLADSYADGILAYLGIESDKTELPTPPPEEEDEIDRTAILKRIESIEWQCKEIRKALE